ncbi:MAG: 4-alpha-glucanotransferase [Burkholderiaceae bacterium]|nr:4-alpha-glucanotransferase [Burkholderiaceae bacterium]
MNLNERASGILLHVTSLPGPHGCGDFGPGAHHVVDWLQSCGQRLWQLLPMNPIGPGNSPYQSVSAFAGSPLMVALEPLVERGWLQAPAPPAFDRRQIDWARVVPWRMEQLRAAAAGFFARAVPAEREAFEAWCRREVDWLDDYAMFMALEAAHRARGVDGGWWAWDAPLAARDPAALLTARREHAGEIAFWRFVQWCFDSQWAALRAYARERGVAVMGDLPIFIAHHSADCWARPDLYFLDDAFQPTVVAGVPPDYFSATGQRWGNPLYRWERMADEGFAWWIARIRRALALADAFRIDHFRGFAGYWEVPASCPTAVEGRWVPAPGQALFDAVEAALGKLPIVAEDLGVITPDVVALRQRFGFPGMRILQFAFAADATNHFLPHNYEPATVVYSGTHDNDTARGWWASATERERAYAGTYLACGEHDVHWAMIRAASNSVADLAVFPLQDVLGCDGRHRMNVPGRMDGNWGWRFDWDDVGAEPGRVLRLITAASGRCAFDRLGLPAYPAGHRLP